MTPLSLLWEIPLLRVITPPLTTWDALLPDQAKRLPDELAQVDTYLDDERFITHWHAHFLHQAGPPLGSGPVPSWSGPGRFAGCATDELGSRRGSATSSVRSGCGAPACGAVPVRPSGSGLGCSPTTCNA
jgi:hypothetical protein